MSTNRLYALLAIATLMLSCSRSDGNFWPDGSPVDGWFIAESAPVSGAEAEEFDITEFGAVQDSTLLQTAAIQRTIDAAAVSGGTVVIPEGVWLSGALFFKPGTHLLLKEGAVLKGSTNVDDFPDIPVHIEGVLQPYVSALVNADRCDGFSISGKGTLDGCGAPFWDAFWARRKENPDCTNLEVRRPRMIGISNSKDITIEGIRLRNSPFWNIHLYKCSRVKVSGIDVHAPVKPVRAPSSDGIDLDGCEDVHIKGCSFATCDDLISLKGGKGPWADEDPDNGADARILVEDCRFGHGPGVLVFGSECVKAENVILRNSIVDGTDRLVWLKMRPDTPQQYRHVLVENISGKVKYAIFVKPWTQFFDLKGREDIPKSYASDILIRNCALDCNVARYVAEAPDQFALEDIELRDNDFSCDRSGVEFLGALQGENAGKRGYAYQGMDICGPYMMSCQNQGIATIYCLSGRKFERAGQFHLGSFHEYNHANVVSFGVEKAEKGDPLPVAYISHCHRKPIDGRKDLLFVERIAPDFGSSELVQTIFYDDVNYDFGYALQWVVDKKNRMLYGYGNTVNNSDPANRHRVIKFRLPALSDGSFVTLKPEDALENYLIEDVSGFRFNPVGQGLFIQGDKLYMPTGVGNSANPSILYIWDLAGHEMQSIDLSSCTTGEFEDISIRGRFVYIQGQDGLFRFKL